MLLDREAVVAVDVEPACVATAASNAIRSGRICILSLCEPGSRAFAELARFHPDSCVCLNVLEHIEDDRRRSQAWHPCSTPGGVIVLLVPAFPALYGPIDRNLGHCRRYRRSIAGGSGHTRRSPHSDSCTT